MLCQSCPRMKPKFFVDVPEMASDRHFTDAKLSCYTLIPQALAYEQCNLGLTLGQRFAH